MSNITRNISATQMSNGILDRFKIIKPLNAGFNAIIYLISYKHQTAILKIRKVIKLMTEDEQKSFYKFTKFTEKYPNHFMQLFEYDSVKNCTWDFSEEYKKINKAIPRKNKTNSNICMYYVYYPVLDNTLEYWMKNFAQFNGSNMTLATKQFYSMLTQLFYIFHIMEREDWDHPDLNSGNLMYKAVDDSTELKTEFGMIPTYGYQWYLIDYESIYMPEIDFHADKEKLEHNIGSKNRILMRVIENMIMLPFWQIIDSMSGDSMSIKNIKSMSHVDGTFDTILKQKECKFLKSMLPPINEPSTEFYILRTLCLLFCTETYCRLRGLNSNVTEIVTAHFKKNLLINRNLYIVIINNLNRKNEIIVKLLNQLNNQ